MTALAQRTDDILAAFDRVVTLAHQAALTDLLVDDVDPDAIDCVEDAFATALARLRPAMKLRLERIFAADETGPAREQ